ncbi:hypothetical protein [Clostridium minihomine]|uniref:hypothetical protein n=1 Tax=Clostridium minihomine TaxID=2045012 RepID=UPI000C75C386|nr:hypothetical protein [Clostridium minihomine]
MLHVFEQKKWVLGLTLLVVLLVLGGTFFFVFYNHPKPTREKELTEICFTFENPQDTDYIILTPKDGAEEGDSDKRFLDENHQAVFLMSVESDHIFLIDGITGNNRINGEFTLSKEDEKLLFLVDKLGAIHNTSDNVLSEKKQG